MSGEEAEKDKHLRRRFSLLSFFAKRGSGEEPPPTSIDARERHAASSSGSVAHQSSLSTTTTNNINSSIINSNVRRPSVFSQPPVEGFQEVPPPLRIPEHLKSMTLKPDSSLKKRFKNFFRMKSRRSSSTVVIGDNAEEVEDDRGLGMPQEPTSTEDEGGTQDELDDVSWKQPESWAVMDQLVTSSPAQARLIQHSETDSLEGQLTYLKVWKPEPRSRSISIPGQRSGQGFNQSKHSHITICCERDASTAQVCALLAKKFASATRESSRFRLYAHHGGLEWMLDSDEMPGMLQRQWLEQAGYNPTLDDIDRLGREDHGYLFRFIYKELPVSSIPRFSTASTGHAAEGADPEQEGQAGRQPSKKLAITAKQAMLAGENLSVVPVAVFEHAKTLEGLDFSRNCLLLLPSDLFEQLTRLRVLSLKSMGLKTFPRGIINAKSITQLNLSNNCLTEDQLEPLAQMTALKGLDLSANRIKSLPDALSSLQYLTSIVLSSNKLTSIPEAVFTFSQLRTLDISFNRIDAIPAGIGRLSILNSLFAAGNKIETISSEIQECKFLKDVDIRGNVITDLGGLLNCDALLNLHADHCRVTSLKEPKWTNLAYLALSNNRMTSVELNFRLTRCQFLDLSKCQITFFPDDLFESLPFIETFIASENDFAVLPKSIAQATHLKVLNVANNRIGDISAVPFESVEFLDLHGNNIKELGGEIWEAKALVTLNVSSNLLTTFPPPPNSVILPPLAACLQNLYLGENRLRDDILDSISLLCELRVLNLAMNELLDVSECFRNLTKLQMLFLSSNAISSLPEDIAHLRSLTHLFINGNRLQTLPGDLAKCLQLQVFDASSNKLNFNISNWPYDWNWSWNLRLQSLDLSENPRLDIKPTQINALQAQGQAQGQGGSSLALSSLTRSSVMANTSSEFKTLSNLKLLNLLNVSVTPECLPNETSALRVKVNTPKEPLALSSLQGHSSLVKALVVEEIPPVYVAEWCGTESTFDCFDFTLRKYLDHSKDHLVGLFDGHGSPLVSGFLYDAFDNYLHAELQRLKPDEDVSNAIRRAFLTVNRSLDFYPGHAEEGASMVVLLLMDQAVYVANVGDCVAVLSKPGGHLVLTHKHNVWSRSEAERVLATGGFISMQGLVGEEMRITRAIGYHRHLPAMIAAPSIHLEELGDNCEFIILATQEFWHYIKPQTAVDLVRASLKDDDFQGAARKLRDLVIAYGTTKSFSVLVVGLAEIMARRRSIGSDSSGGGLSGGVGGVGGGSGGVGGGAGGPSSSGVSRTFGRGRASRRTFTTQTQQNPNGPATDAWDVTLGRLEPEIPPPEGLVSIVFTDIKDSTNLWQTYPAPMRAAIRIHNDIMRRTLRGSAGTRSRTTGTRSWQPFRRPRRRCSGASWSSASSSTRAPSGRLKFSTRPAAWPSWRRGRTRGRSRHSPSGSPRSLRRASGTAASSSTASRCAWASTLGSPFAMSPTRSAVAWTTLARPSTSAPASPPRPRAGRSCCRRRRSGRSRAPPSSRTKSPSSTLAGSA